jgi:vacuolar protein sorting-associated protein 41
VSSISISPFPLPLAAARPEGLKRLASEAQSTAPKPSHSPPPPGAKNSPQKQQVPNTPSNQIYIATSSIDGNVCVASLIDSKDVQLRNFGRPVQSVALSPDYRNDRNYLSGGQAGNLIFTTGGQAGRTANATTTGAAAAASGWLGSIGLGANTGTDKVLHGGEGVISTIKWSLSGRYVIWVNEQGIKIMRSNLYGADAATEWKRLSHRDKPNRQGWDVMAGVWKARAEWVDRENLEDDETTSTASALTKAVNGKRPELTRTATKQIAPEEAVVGWGDAVWLFRVQARGGKIENGQDANASGRVEVVTM